MNEFGGNVLKIHAIEQDGEKVLCKNPYRYSIYTVSNKEIEIAGLSSFTVFVLKAQSDVLISGDLFEKNLKVNMAAQIEGYKQTLKLKVDNGTAVILVAGSEAKSNSAKQGVFIKKSEQLYKVDKPWGHELWINGEHELYAFKEIFIKAGTKTSLQYHHYKQETNLLVNGNAFLHYKSSVNISNEKVQDKDISRIEITDVSSVDASPLVLHRLEAISDITLYETSTPHLNDVIRISDDADRPDGRIDSEHQAE